MFLRQIKLKLVPRVGQSWSNGGKPCTSHDPKLSTGEKESMESSPGFSFFGMNNNLVFRDGLWGQNRGSA